MKEKLLRLLGKVTYENQEKVQYILREISSGEGFTFECDDILEEILEDEGLVLE